MAVEAGGVEQCLHGFRGSEGTGGGERFALGDAHHGGHGRGSIAGVDGRSRREVARRDVRTPGRGGRRHRQQQLVALLALATSRRRLSSSNLLVPARAVRPSKTTRSEASTFSSVTFCVMALLAKRVSELFPPLTINSSSSAEENRRMRSKISRASSLFSIVRPSLALALRRQAAHSNGGNEGGMTIGVLRAPLRRTLRENELRITIHRSLPGICDQAFAHRLSAKRSWEVLSA
jgi:hypothetical protein